MSSLQSILKMAGRSSSTPSTTIMSCERQLVIMVGIPGSGKTTKTIQEINKKNKGMGLDPQPNPFYPEEVIETSTETIQETTQETNQEAGAACAAASSSSISTTPTTKVRAIGCSADNYPGLYTPEGQITDLGLLPSAHEWCQRSVEECMEKGHEIYLDNTNLRPEFWVDYLRLAQTHGYKVKIVIPTNKLLYYEASGKNTFDQQLAHLKTVRCSGSRRIPEHAMNTMYSQFVSTINFVGLNKGSCGTDPSRWLAVCSRYRPSATSYSRR